MLYNILNYLRNILFKKKVKIPLQITTNLIFRHNFLHSYSIITVNYSSYRNKILNLINIKYISKK